MIPAVPVRAFASGVVHLADDRPWSALVAVGRECRGSLEPVVTLCYATIGRGRGVVVMQPGTRVGCAGCRRAAVRRGD